MVVQCRLVSNLNYQLVIFVSQCISNFSYLVLVLVSQFQFQLVSFKKLRMCLKIHVLKIDNVYQKKLIMCIHTLVFLVRLANLINQVNQFNYYFVGQILGRFLKLDLGFKFICMIELDLIQLFIYLFTIELDLIQFRMN